VRCALALLLLLAGPALGQERITADMFLDRVTGRTATFVAFQDGALVGVEQFVRRDRTVWARADGTCAYGAVTVQDGAVCFAYDDEPRNIQHCWIPFEVDERLLVVTRDGSEVQEITRLSDAPVSCEPPPTS